MVEGNSLRRHYQLELLPRSRYLSVIISMEFLRSPFRRKASGGVAECLLFTSNLFKFGNILQKYIGASLQLARLFEAGEATRLLRLEHIRDLKIRLRRRQRERHISNRFN